MTSLAKHSAAPHLAGYVFQLPRALYRLAAHPAALGVGVETLDDVVVTQPDGALICEQDKTTSTDGGAPLADRRPGLWKSLGIWADAIATKELDPTAAEFHLVTNAHLSAGLAHTLSLVQGDAAKADAAVAALRAYAPSLPLTLRPTAERLLRHPDSVLSAMLKRLSCYCMSDDTSGPSLRTKTAKLLRLSETEGADEVIDGLLGWLQTQVLAKIFAGEHAWISTEAFNNQLHALVERNRRRRFRELPASQVLVSDAERTVNRGRLFVEQLALIGAQEEEVVDAVDDYVRFGRERLRLSYEGEIPDDEWTSFDGRLIDNWKPLFRQHAHVTEEQCASVGRQIYSTVQGHRETLAGTQTIEFYVTRGAYHRLADTLDVGWHPKFRERFAKAAS
jgi:hypothetical protein